MCQQILLSLRWGQRVSFKTSSLGAGIGKLSRLFWGRTCPQMPGARGCEQATGSLRNRGSLRLGGRKTLLDGGDVPPAPECTEKAEGLSVRWGCLGKVTGAGGRESCTTGHGLP